MTEQMSGYGSRAREEPPGWAVGFIVFAAVTMMTGVFPFWSLLSLLEVPTASN